MALNTRSTLAALSVGAATVAALVGCSSPGPTTGPAVTAGPAATASAGTPTSTVTVTVTQPAPPQNPPAITAPAPQQPRPDEPGNFMSPSGNIICGLSASAATCEVREFTYAPPPKPASCHLGWGDRVSLDLGEAPIVRCHGDTQFGSAPGQPVLAYGQTRSAGTITCDSEPTGMTCTDSTTGHYFRISRDSLVIA